jgi:hypothetical protein
MDQPSSSRSDVRIAFGARPSNTAARRGGFRFDFGLRRFGGDADRRRDHREVDPLFILRLLAVAANAAVGARRAFGTIAFGANQAVGIDALRTLSARGALGALLLLRLRLAILALGTIVALVAVGAWLLRLLLAILSIRTILLLVTARLLALIFLLLLLLGLMRLIVVAVHLAVEAFALAIVVIVVIDVLTPRAALFVEPRAAFAEHAEIMVGELEIIFGLNAVTRKLGIARHALVFLEQLRRIATLPIVAGVAAAVTRHSLGTLSTTAATATSAVLTIIDQKSWSSSHWRQSRLILSFARSPVLRG